MAARSAIQHHPDLARISGQLREPGKPGKVALTVPVRQLIVLANGLPKEDREWYQMGRRLLWVPIRHYAGECPGGDCPT